MLDTRVQLPPYSAWAVTPVYEAQSEGESVVVFGLRQGLVAQDPTDIFYTIPVAAQFRIDMISQSFYGTPELWHVICDVNPILDPIIGFDIGTNIRVPTKARLAQLGLLTL